MAEQDTIGLWKYRRAMWGAAVPSRQRAVDAIEAEFLADFLNSHLKGESPRSVKRPEGVPARMLCGGKAAHPLVRAGERSPSDRSVPMHAEASSPREERGRRATTASLLSRLRGWMGRA